MEDEGNIDFMKIGCTSTREAAISLQIYLELSEIKKYWEIEYQYNSNINQLYFTARKFKCDDTIIFVPLAVSDKICFSDMQKYFKLSDNDSNQSVCLVICSPDTTSVYYNITNGIADPPSEAAIQFKEDNREKLDKNLIKNKALLEQAAMYGLPITLSKNRQMSTGNDNDHYSD